MNDLKERYLESALDERYNGGPSPDLEGRILAGPHHAAPPRAHWWLAPAACAAVATALFAVVLFARQETAESRENPVVPAVSTYEQEPVNSEASPAGLGNRYAIVEVTTPDTDKPGAPMPDVGIPEAELLSPSEEFTPDPDEPISVDFVQKDLHVVMHYISLRTGLQIIVEGEVSVKLTVMFSKIDPKEAIQAICKANKLDYIEDGNIIIIKRRPKDLDLAHVTKAETPAVYTVSFEDQDVVSAIMEVATVTKTAVLVPAVPDGEEGEQFRNRKINLYMKNATPDAILRKLAELGGMEVEVVELGGGVNYKFSEDE